MEIKYRFILFISLYFLLSLWACKHSPILPDDDDNPPIDTMDVIVDTMDVIIDTMDVTVDTTDMNLPCDPNIVYFDQEILPILVSNCAFSGCHDADSAEDGVILESYESVLETADVEPFDLLHSEIYTVLVDDDEDQRMPPVPNNALPQEQIQLISKWILQGAEDLHCDPDATDCNTEAISFVTHVQPVLATYCIGCHSGNVPSGAIDLSEHSGVKIVAENGKLYGTIAWETGFSMMPQGGSQLSDCTINQIKSWIDDGALNN